MRVGFVGGPWDGKFSELKASRDGSVPVEVQLATPQSVARLEKSAEAVVYINRVRYQLTQTKMAPQLGIHHLYMYVGEA